MSVSQGDLFRIVVSLVFPDDVIMQNVFHVILTTLVGDGEEADITLDLNDYVDTIYQNHDANIADDIAGDEVKAYVFDLLDEDWDEIGTGSLDVTTSSSEDRMPHGCAVLQSYFTINPDVQGRKYWGGFTEGGQTDGDWVGTLLTNIVLSAADVVTIFVGVETGSTFAPVVWSPTKSTPYLYSGVVATAPVVAYQRRRKPGVGI